ncbi:MAG: hypothetical protein NTV58_10760 [Deltaproteobacteria bacterium]|nr:hypothetical protein [Deltaproteobacteria bacterium]
MFEQAFKNMGNAGRNGGEEVIHRSPQAIMDGSQHWRQRARRCWRRFENCYEGGSGYA